MVNYREIFLLCVFSSVSSKGSRIEIAQQVGSDKILFERRNLDRFSIDPVSTDDEQEDNMYPSTTPRNPHLDINNFNMHRKTEEFRTKEKSNLNSINEDFEIEDLIRRRRSISFLPAESNDGEKSKHIFLSYSKLISCNLN